MNYLIDTHVLLWFGLGSEQLPARIRQIMLDRQNTLLVSYAAIWEMTIKHSLGKLDLHRPLSEWEALLVENNFALLQPSFPHFEVLDALPFYHQDPFDRLMIAQAISEGLTLISHDQKFEQYPVQLERF